MLKILDKPELKKRPKMKSDVPLDKDLLKYEMLKVCFSQNNLTLLCGEQGQGKSSLLQQIFSSSQWYNRKFESVYLIMPDESMDNIEKNIFDDLPDECVFNQLNNENLTSVYESLKESAKNGENSCLIIDDFQEQLKDKTLKVMLEKICNKIRNLHVTVFILLQNWTMCPKPIRLKAFNLITYDIGKEQMEQVYKEMIKKKRANFERMLEIGFEDFHDWVVVNRKKRIFKGFDEIVI